MGLILKTVFFLVFCILHFWSVVGYGKTLTNKNSIYFENYLNGNIIILILSYIIYLTIGTSLTINLIIIFIGLILFFFKKKNFSVYYKQKYFFTITICIFSFNNF